MSLRMCWFDSSRGHNEKSYRARSDTFWSGLFVWLNKANLRAKIRKSMRTLFLILLALPVVCAAQVPPSSWIDVNSVRARIVPNGNMFHSNGFLVPQAHDTDPNRRWIFNGVFPWIGGKDPAGNLMLSAAAIGGPQSDFKHGIMLRPGYEQVWRVTGDEIRAHQADFWDNGVIDNPIPAILNWPSPINNWGFFGEQFIQVGPFNDLNSNGLYEPELGEYPTPAPNYGKYIPDEILFFAFHDSTAHGHTGGLPLPMQVFCTVFATNCPEQPALHHTIFVHYRYYYHGLNPVNDLYFGFLVDYEIGHAEDDYIGSIDKRTFIGYNGDALDEGVFGNNPPVAAVSVLSPPWWSNGLTEATFVPIYPGPPAAVQYPALPHEFYAYLSGRFKNQVPLTAAGTGYNLGSSAPPVCCAFPDDPSLPGGWSEPSAGNPPGNRRAVLSLGPVRMLPMSDNDATLAFHWARGETPGPLSGYQNIQEQAQWMSWHLSSSLSVHPPDLACLQSVSYLEPAPATAPLRIAPNPATTSIRVGLDGRMAQQARLYSISGRLVQALQIPEGSSETVELALPNLPTGLYLLELQGNDGQRRWGKFVVQH